MELKKAGCRGRYLPLNLVVSQPLPKRTQLAQPYGGLVGLKFGNYLQRPSLAAPVTDGGYSCSQPLWLQVAVL